MPLVNSRKGLTPHTPPEEDLIAFFFYALAQPIDGAQPASL